MTPERNWQQPQDQQQDQREPHPERAAKEEDVRAGFAGIEQAGLDPRNKPSRLIDLREGERDPHKTTRDLEDITGNPGHLNVTPYAPMGSINPVVGPEASSGPPSINEPPGSQVAEPAEWQDPNQGAQNQEQQPPEAGWGSDQYPPEGQQAGPYWDAQSNSWRSGERQERREQRQDQRQDHRQDQRQEHRQAQPR